MKRLGVIALVSGIVLAGSVVSAVAAGPGAEVDPSTGTVQGTIVPRLVSCAGEDGSPLGSYIKILQKLSGGSTDTTPAGSGDFSLTGTLTSTATLTINTSTGQGWGNGLLTVSNSANTISGPVTVVVQITNPNPLTIVARGLWVGTVLDATGAPTGDLSVQNFELQGGATSFTGSWGTAASIPDLSVKTTKVRC